MKLLTYLFTLFFAFNALAVAPYGIKGQSQTGTLYSNVHQFPNNQVTNLGGINALVETGNQNILIDPSLEGANNTSAWVFTGGVLTIDNTPIHGKFNGQVDTTATSLSMTQSSTLYQAQFADGVQGLASMRVRVPTSVTTPIYVCSIQNGVEGSVDSGCVQVQANGKWGLYKVPFILGGTSNGIALTSKGVSFTNSVEWDDAFVGAVDLSATQSFDTTCDTIACETSFAGYVNAAGGHSTENQDFISSASVASTSTFTVNFTASTFSVAPACTVTTADPAGATTNGSVTTIISINTTSLVYRTNRHDATAVAYPAYIHCDRVQADYTTAMNARKAFQKSKVSSFSSNNADTDWASCGLTGSALTGFGTAVPTPELQCKRQGSDLLMKGKFTAGTTPTAVEARLNLPIWNGVQLTSASTGKIPSIQLAGFAGISASSAASFYTLIEPSVTYMTFSFQSAANNTLLKQNANAFVTTGTIVTLHARIPINGWENSNIIIGQFNGLESCTDSYECEDIYSARVSAAGVITEETPGDWINGSATQATGAFIVPFVSGRFTVAPQCWAEIEVNTTGWMAEAHTTSSSQVLVKTSQGISASSGAFTLYCRKQGADYIGKTAKAVASDQNLRTPSVTNAVFISAEISSAGVVSQEDSDFINGSCAVTDTSLYACTWNTSYWASAPKCMPNITNGSQNFKAEKEAIPTTASGVFRTANSTTGAKSASGFTLFCHGVKL